jgi:hypothetical protein
MLLATHEIELATSVQINGVAMSYRLSCHKAYLVAFQLTKKNRLAKQNLFPGVKSLIS